MQLAFLLQWQIWPCAHNLPVRPPHLPVQMSSPFAGEVVESADAYLFAGAVFTDYSTAGYSLNLSEVGRLTKLLS